MPTVLITALWWTVTLAFFVLFFGVQPAEWPLSALFFAVPFFAVGSRFVYGCMFGLFSRATLRIDAKHMRAREFHILIPPREIVIPTDTITSIDMHPRRPPNGHLTYDLVAKQRTGEDITLLESPHLPQGQFVAARLQGWVDAHHGRPSGHPTTAPRD